MVKFNINCVVALTIHKIDWNITASEIILTTGVDNFILPNVVI